MSAKITLYFSDGTSTEIWTSKLKSISFAGATLEMMISPSTGELLTAYSKYVYKYNIVAVDINYDEQEN